MVRCRPTSPGGPVKSRRTDLELLQVELYDLVARALNPHAVMSKHAELLRGGFGTTSLLEGSRGSEPPIPVMQPVRARDDAGTETEWYPPALADPVDRELNRKARAYARHFDAAVRELRAALEIQSWFLVPAPVQRDTAQKFIPCQNIRCPRGLEAGRNSGECSTCRSHRSKYGLPWPIVNNGTA